MPLHWLQKYAPASLPNERATVNLRIADRYVHDVLNRRSVEPLTELLAESFEYTGPMTSVQGRDAYIAFMSDLWKAWTDWQIRVTGVRATANTAILEHDFSATHAAPYFGIPASGQRFTVRAQMAFRFRDSLISTLSVSYSAAHLMEQIGVGRSR